MSNMISAFTIFIEEHFCLNDITIGYTKSWELKVAVCHYVSINIIVVLT